MATNIEKRARSIMIELPPFPEGWYFVAERREIQRRNLIEKTWLGEQIVAWYDLEGRICVADAYCPHLGSHMGPTAGGTVRDGCLVCPFHGFVFNTSGRCVATPNAPPPRAAQLKLYHTREICGMIFAWWGIGGRPPQWHLPEEPSTDTVWGRLRSTALRFRGHPQETTENSVDLEHLAYTHGYHDVEPTASLSVDGAYLKSCFDFKNVRKVMGVFGVESDISTITHVHGLGYSFVEIHESNIGLDARMWVLATPIDGEFIEVTLATQVQKIRRPRRFMAGLRFLPPGLRQRLMGRFLLSEERRFVAQDVVIWERKRYRSPPRLCRTDGPIGKYRLYCRQFYPGVGSTHIRRDALARGGR